MFLNFFYELKQAGIPVSVKEYLTFMSAIDAGVAGKKDRRLLLSVPRCAGEGRAPSR